MKVKDFHSEEVNQEEGPEPVCRRAAVDGPGPAGRPSWEDVAEVPQMEPPAAVAPELPGHVVPQPAPLQCGGACELDVLLRVRAHL